MDWLMNLSSEHDGASLSCVFGLQTKKLEAEVLAPMQRWMTAYNTVQVCTMLFRS